MLKMRLGLFVLIFSFYDTSAIAGPFGLEMGMSLKDIGGEIVEEVENRMYKLNNVPNPHSAFLFYAVTVAPKAGLCQIFALGKPFNVNSFGTQTKIEFAEMRQKLEATYGKSELMDILYPGSIWGEPKDWAMGLFKKERVYSAGWEAKKGAPLSANLKKIDLMVSALKIDENNIFVRYRFTNYDACEAELKSNEDKAL